MEFRRGDFVWGKLKSHPWWPAMVITAEDCCKTNSSKNKIWLFWFGDHRISEVNIENIRAFKDFFSQNEAKRVGTCYKKGVEEILHIIASVNQLKFKDGASLLLWAKSGFKSKSQPSFKWTKSELPEVVGKALTPSKKSSVPSDETDVNSSQVSEDEDYEDSCIGSCKDKATLTAPHPLFMGNVCIKCGRDIYKACDLPTGKVQGFCVICARQGDLVHCSNESCYRSFCKSCIEYFQSAAIYTEILSKTDWMCYLCETNPDRNCLIQSRNLKQETAETLKKIPITVLADTKAGLVAFQRANTEVKSYQINSAVEKMDAFNGSMYCSEYNFCDYREIPPYHEFSEKEVQEMAADLIIGSCFVSVGQTSKKEYQADFFIKFYRLLFRLDISRLAKPNVFFIFIADVSLLDDRSLSRVQRFLKVDPVSMHLGRKKILVWNNLKKNLPKVFQKELFANNVEIQEKVLFHCIKDLKNSVEFEELK